MPTSRADSGSAAAARIARPIRVNWKNRYSPTSSSRVTPIMPAWWVEISWLPRNGEDPNGVGYCLMVKSQIRPATRVDDGKQRDEAGDVGQHRRLRQRLEQQPLDQDAAGKGDAPA